MKKKTVKWRQIPHKHRLTVQDEGFKPQLNTLMYIIRLFVFICECVCVQSYRVHVFRRVSRGRVIIRLLRRLRLSLLLLPDLDDNFPVGREKHTQRQYDATKRARAIKQPRSERVQSCLLQRWQNACKKIRPRSEREDFKRSGRRKKWNQFTCVFEISVDLIPMFLTILQNTNTDLCLPTYWMSYNTSACKRSVRDFAAHRLQWNHFRQRSLCDKDGQRWEEQMQPTVNLLMCR